MFLFLQFILDNVRPYADVHALCLTSTESIEFMTRYYRCVKPMALPFPRFRLKQKGASAWDKFTNYFLSKPVFREPSEHRMRLCILFDFMKASHHPFAAVPNPHYMVITLNGLWYCDRQIIKSHYDTWFTNFEIGHNMPFFVHIWTMDRTVDHELYGIVFTELEYMSQYDIYFDRRTGALYDYRPYLYFLKAHVVQTLGCTYVIVLLRESIYCETTRLANKKIQARFDFYIADDADMHETIDGRISTDIDAFTDRFHTK